MADADVRALVAIGGKRRKANSTRPASVSARAVATATFRVANSVARVNRSGRDAPVAAPMPLPILAWEKQLEYMLGMLAQLGIVNGTPFNPDIRTERILEDAARTAVDEMRVVFYASRHPAHIAWKDRTWEWFPLQLISAQTGDFGVSAAIGKPAVGAGSVYWLAFRDGTGAYLDGGKTYKLTVPGQAAGQRGRLFRSLLRPAASRGRGSHVGEDHPGQGVVVRFPHLRPGSVRLRRHVEAQRHCRGEDRA